MAGSSRRGRSALLAGLLLLPLAAPAGATDGATVGGTDDPTVGGTDDATVAITPGPVPDADHAGDLDAPFGLASVEQLQPASVEQLQPASVDDALFGLQWYLARTRVPEAWELTTGEPDVTVAIIDTGVDPAHQDLDGALWSDPSTGSYGLDLVDGTGTPYSSPGADWHGTAIAGVIAARADDDYGIAGVAPDVAVMVMRIYSSASDPEPPVLEGGYGLAIDAINEAVAAGADVILLSWGGQDPSIALRNTIAAAGVPVVVAAGNDRVDLSADDAGLVRYPAMYRLPNMITVTASSLDDARWLVDERIGANVGERHVDIAAPGELILGPVPAGQHRYRSGTSFAAPQVAGALALAVSIAPRAEPAELIGELSRTARQVPAFADTVTSGGILDVAAFLTAVQRPVCTDEVPPAGYLDVTPGSTHASGIDCITAFELAEGVGDDRFAPSRPVTRGQMAAFLNRLLVRAGAIDPPGEDTPADDAEPDPTSEPHPSFSDIAGTTHEAAIEVVNELGIAQGFQDGTFRPNESVTRGQMASLLVRTVEQLTGDTFDAERNWFDDIEATTHESSILAARELAITLGTASPRTFEPNRTLTRAQLASLLARSLDALAREGVVLEPPAR